MKSILTTLLISIYSLGMSQSSFKGIFESKINALYQEYDLKSDFVFGIVDSTGLSYSYFIKGESNKLKKIDSSTPFYLASHTKAMTGTLLKIMESKGLVALDSPVSKYLPELNFNGKIDPKKISLKSLLSHTHGIRNNILAFVTAYIGYSGGYQTLISILNNYSDFDSTNSFMYSNVGPIVAGIVIEKLTGNDWRTTMDKLLFEPLNMKKTSGFVSDYDPQTILFTTINKDARDNGFYKLNSTMHASGGIISNLEDLGRWVHFNITKGKERLIENFDKNNFDDLHHKISEQNRNYNFYNRFGYTLGWDMARYQGDTLLTRFGGFSNVSIHVSFNPTRKLGIISYSNEDRAARLPHIAANLAYNLITDNPNWDEIYNTEKTAYNNSISRYNENIQARQTSRIEKEVAIVGTYGAKPDMPEIKVVKKDGQYILYWGEVYGFVQINEISQDTINCSVDFKSFGRDFDFIVKAGRTETIKTGSLTYFRKRD